MSMFFNFGHTCDDGGDGEDCDECNRISENKPKCEHEPDWAWPSLKELTYHCKKCGEFYR
jgi:hypothetical protein